MRIYCDLYLALSKKEVRLETVEITEEITNVLANNRFLLGGFENECHCLADRVTKTYERAEELQDRIIGKIRIKIDQ